MTTTEEKREDVKTYVCDEKANYCFAYGRGYWHLFGEGLFKKFFRDGEHFNDTFKKEEVKGGVLENEN